MSGLLCKTLVRSRSLYWEAMIVTPFPCTLCSSVLEPENFRVNQGYGTPKAWDGYGKRLQTSLPKLLLSLNGYLSNHQ